MGAIGWILSNIVMGFQNIFNALIHPMSWLNWADKEALVRFIYYGGSVEFFFVCLDIFLVFTLIGFFNRNLLWGYVRLWEWKANLIGRVAGYAALILVLQQVLIVVLGMVFRVSGITIAPFGIGFTKDLSWFSEELKLYNAILVSLCCAYTFIQGGHVRVDLFYAGMSFRKKRIIDMFGSLFFIVPAMVLIWMYSWFFMWRHLVTPKVSATDKLDLLLKKSTILKWNVETTGFSPNGFNGYFLFKMLMVLFAGMMIAHAISFFYRSFLECVEGEESAKKYLDEDVLGDEMAQAAHDAH